MADNKVTPEFVSAWVRDEENRTSSLRQRMEDDYAIRWLLQWKDTRDRMQEDTARTHVSNDPRTYAKKANAFLVAAGLTVRLPEENKSPEERDDDNIREKFIRGSLTAGDEYLRAIGQPDLRVQMAWYATIRGFSIGRAMLVKDTKRKVRVEIMPFDPLHTFWEFGHLGIHIVIHRVMKSAAMIKRQYDIDVSDDGSTDLNKDIAVYDYYDAEENGVCTDTRWLKKLTKHQVKSGAPIWFSAAGTQPNVQPRNGTTTMSDYGESIFSDNRATENTKNEIASDLKTIIDRSANPPLMIKSPGGRRTFSEDPRLSGSDVPLDVNEAVEPFPMVEMARETAGFLGGVYGEAQRGAIPYTSFGEIPFQLSGYAIETLSQGVTSVIQPAKLAMESSYCQIVGLLSEQFASGGFAPITLRGQMYNRSWFMREFKSADIKGMDAPIIQLHPRMPKDDPAKFAMAQIAREGAKPLLPDRVVRSDVLEYEDVDLIEDAVAEQMATSATPMALLYTMMVSAQKMGRDDLAQIYLLQLMQLTRQTVGGGAPPGAGGAPAGPPGPAAPDGFDPRVATGGAMGIPPVPPQGQVGPTVGPGQPRPGAQSEESRLARIGLVPGR